VEPELTSIESGIKSAIKRDYSEWARARQAWIATQNPGKRFSHSRLWEIILDHMMGQVTK
jgi:hypothetical protein